VSPDFLFDDKKYQTLMSVFLDSEPEKRELWSIVVFKEFHQATF